VGSSGEKVGLKGGGQNKDTDEQQVLIYQILLETIKAGVRGKPVKKTRWVNNGDEDTQS